MTLVSRKVEAYGKIDFPQTFLDYLGVKVGDNVDLDTAPGNNTVSVRKHVVPPPAPFVDGFDQDYVLANGETSPDGRWFAKYTSGGRIASENGVMHMYPRTVTSPSETSASEVLSKPIFTDFVLDFDVRTNKQLRINSAPNTWETAWIFFRFTDEAPKSNHHYYFVLKRNGYEFGKKDNKPGDTGLEKQIFLATGGSPAVTIGSFQHIRVTAVGFKITITVNGNKIIDMTDTANDPAKMVKGNIGLYSEDADVSFDNVVLQPVIPA